jgi:phosphatidate cytidylyltransferase
MAFNWKTFQTRTLTAIVFAAVMLTGLLWNQWSFLILFSIIHFGCWWEYLKLGEKIYNTSMDKTIKYFFCICGYILMLAIGFRLYTYNIYWIPLGDKVNFRWVVIILLIGLLFIFLFQNNKLPDKLKWFVFSGLAYISLSWGMMLLLNGISIKITYANHLPPFPYGGFNPTSIEYRWNVPLLIIGSIWINDTMAYIIGSLIGKTPLSKVSPKKTWEGTIGGILLAVGISILVAKISDFQVLFFAITVLVSVMAGTFGDLLESKLKRMAAVKDSGNFMPGHGGFLDRFDSLLLATPAVWLYVYFLMR